MDTKEIIRLANACGVGDKDLSDDDSVVTDYGNSTAEVLRFAEAIANAEREECAKTCEALWAEEAKAAAEGTQEPKYHDCIECAYAIRARSNAELTGAARRPG